MKVSVIVTTYNRPEALVRVLDGLLAQTRPPDEIIIADDGSGEETRAALTPYLERHTPAVIHVWQEDKGFRAAMSRNRAILAASGEYLVLLDGDCIPGPGYIADHLDLARPGCFFQGKRILVNARAAAMFSYRDTASLFKCLGLALTGGLSNSHHLLGLSFLPPYRVKGLGGIRSCNMGLFRQDAVAVNGFNHDFTGWGREDTEFVIRLFKYGLLRMEHPFRAVCYHLWHPENPRDNLDKNDRLLAEVADSDYFYCAHGLDDLRNEKGST